ncbi:MAG: 3',5'-cyclic-nucleotide phosphodiesterase [Betaproteobacteria bacterium]|nr:3',5'-cyclic-nucleotide phosphodiesterase [Betaproteobacteria bacterium]
MEVRILGCSGGIGGLAHRTTSLMVDDDILIDCGTGVAVLELDQLLAIEHVFITHAHLDHVCFLPFLIDTVGELRDRPITVHAVAETLHIIRSHIFNWLIWPDFSAIPDRAKPMLRFNELEQGESMELANRTISVLPALHTVPASGFRLQSEGGSLVFSGDTTLCDPLVEALNAMDDLKTFIVETAFTNAQHDLALAARHLCPNMLFTLLDSLSVSPEVYITHLKPAQADQIRSEIAVYQGRLKPRFLESDQILRI